MGENGTMSSLFGPPGTLVDPTALPTGEVVGRYGSYLDAQRAVDHLVEQNFAVEKVSVVGQDLRMVERVTGKLTYARVAVRNAVQGAFFGLFIGILFSIFDPNPAGLALSLPLTIVIGIAFWVASGVFGMMLRRNRREFTSISQVMASSFDVMVPNDVAAQARGLLAQVPNGQGTLASSSGYPTAPADQNNQPSQPAAQRPEQWSDPYQTKAPHTPTGEGTAVQAQGATASDESVRARGTYPDLPDGRPQFGVRVDPGNDPQRENHDGGDSPNSTS